MLRPTDCNSRLGSECEVSALRFCTYFFAESVNEITLRPRHASPISTHIVETDHPPILLSKSTIYKRSLHCLETHSIPLAMVTVNYIRGSVSTQPPGSFTTNTPALFYLCTRGRNTSVTRCSAPFIQRKTATCRY